MVVLNIYSLDDTEQQKVIACLQEGKHTIGRGGYLNVSDKRVSRKHAVIEVSDDRVSLTSVHVNPCFFRAANGAALTVVSQNEECELHDGDQFALLPEDYWFRVRIKIELSDEPHLTISGKRSYDTHLDENNSCSDTKKARLSSNSAETSVSNRENVSAAIDTTETSQKIVHNNSSTSQSEKEIKLENNDESFSSLNLQETARIEDIQGQEPPTAIKDESSDSIQGENKDINNLSRVHDENQATIKDEPPGNASTSGEYAQAVPVTKTENNGSKDTPSAAASSSGSTEPQSGPRKVRRERCWYGDRCFRKNPNHRESFSHPGDQDYDSDPDDDRPNCPYGMACYRKNPDHRREYKHVARPAPKPRQRSTTPSPPGSPSVNGNTGNTPPEKKKPKRKATSKKPKGRANADSEDDYDYDDPFLNDGSSDDFEPSDYGIDSSDSDLEYSQEVEEESRERRRMLKEAKKFTKKGSE